MSIAEKKSGETHPNGATSGEANRSSFSNSTDNTPRNLEPNNEAKAPECQVLHKVAQDFPSSNPFKEGSTAGIGTPGKNDTATEAIGTSAMTTVTTSDSKEAKLLPNPTTSVTKSQHEVSDNKPKESITVNPPLTSEKGGESNKTNPTLTPSTGTTEKPEGADPKPVTKTKPEKRSTKPKKNKAHLRKGKWTPEEEEYTMRIIQHFRTGLLSLPDGHTLRSHLAEKLNCDPMRITKKFSGASCLGKRVYNLCDRSQVSSRDLELAKLELVSLERRFRLRIEHGSSIPVSSHFSERLRNTRNELDHANFMRASYLFVNHPSQDQVNAGDLNAQASPAIAPPNNYGNSNFSLAFLQSLANGQHQAQQRAPSIPPHQGFQHGGSLQDRFQLQNQLHRQQQANPSLRRNGATPFFDMQDQPQLNSNLLSALMSNQVAGVAAPPQTADTAKQLSALGVLGQPPNPAFSSPSLSSFSERASQISGRGMQQGTTGMMLQDQSSTAIEALAARYGNAALTKNFQRQGFPPQQNPHQLPISRNEQLELERNSNFQNSLAERQRELSNSMQNGMKKIRSKEEQAEGRILLGFLQELQTNHQKAKLSSSSNMMQGTLPQLQGSTVISSDDTLTTRDSLNSSLHNNFGKGQKDNILKRGFDISVKKENGVESSSTMSSYFETVPNNEALSGSSGGSSGENEDDKEQGGSSGDDDKDMRAGPLRKRFRRASSQSPELES